MKYFKHYTEWAESMKKTHKRETCNIKGCIIYYLKKLLTTPHLDSHTITDPKPDVLSAV